MRLILVLLGTILLCRPSVAIDIPSWMTLEKREIKDEVWPELEVVATIEADPISSVAIFAAYDYQKHYIPGLLESNVVLEEVSKTGNKTNVKYALDMPWPLSDSQYVHGHELTRLKEDTFKVRWYVVQSDSAEMVRGHAIFGPHPTLKGKTQMTYVSLVRPKSFLAGIFKKIMVGDVIKSLTAIKLTTEKLIKSDKKLVEKYQDKIRQVLAGKRAYLP